MARRNTGSETAELAGDFGVHAGVHGCGRHAHHLSAMLHPRLCGCHCLRLLLLMLLLLLLEAGGHVRREVETGTTLHAPCEHRGVCLGVGLRLRLLVLLKGKGLILTLLLSLCLLSLLQTLLEMLLLLLLHMKVCVLLH